MLQSCWQISSKVILLPIRCVICIFINKQVDIYSLAKLQLIMFAVMAFTAHTSAQSADIPSIGFCGNTLYISNGTKNPKDLRFKALINNKANVLSDMLSDSIKYKDFQSTYFLCIIYMYEFRIENPYIQFRQIANQPVH